MFCILYLYYVPVSVLCEWKNTVPTLTSGEISDLAKKQRTQEGRALRMNPQYKILNKKLQIWNEMNIYLQSTLKREVKDLISTNDFERKPPRTHSSIKTKEGGRSESIYR